MKENRIGHATLEIPLKSQDNPMIPPSNDPAGPVEVERRRNRQANTEAKPAWG
ncbi:MAG: hypothetical protein MI747_07715 [Desulfobacterales bacterium]|nr:hypothetical protein [Desulfobacterales bacterium]